MPIHTVPVDKNTYVRIIGVSMAYGNLYKKKFIGRVGIVTARGVRDNENLMFILIGNTSYVFNVSNLESITEKEYFLGVLNG